MKLEPVAWIDPDSLQALQKNGSMTTYVQGKKHNMYFPTPLYAIPDGYVVVPVQPTGAMIDAAVNTPQMQMVNSIVGTHSLRCGGSIGLGPTKSTSAIAEAYRAMIAAKAES